ncbi:MAG TPA: FCD domain-containing protein [Acetobacteraceae bacterium]|nr:FCD domain-containing protein [Acetobacteraceae bacterium]
MTPRIGPTVVREAVAGLSAEGWEEARQGSGVFVKVAPRVVQVTAKELPNLEDVLALLELRIAVETEMAGLAAERRADVAAIEAWMEEFCAAIDEQADGIDAGAALYAAIARATRNQHFVRFIAFHGTILLPCRAVPALFAFASLTSFPVIGLSLGSI